MILSVTTSKSDAADLRTFVARNLANGIDHMLVFLDAPNPEAEAFLRDHPHATGVRTGKRWWRGQRPAALNTRQTANANIANAVCSTFSWAEWLFHIDSDEVAHFDRDELEGLPVETTAVRLDPLEAVSEWEPRQRQLFKRSLSVSELELLTALDVIGRPENTAYFRGHLAGKSGHRPSLQMRAGIHAPSGITGEPIPLFEASWLKLLHFEAVSGQAFVQKWNNISSSGPRPKMRPSRARVLGALEAISSLDLPEEIQHKYLRRLHALRVADDVDTLLDLNLLQHWDVDHIRFTPRATATHKEEIAASLQHARGADKVMFRLGSLAEPEGFTRSLSGPDASQ